VTRAGRSDVLVAYAAFVLVGIGAGVIGVLLPAQIRDYRVDEATIGIGFFTGAAGFVLAGASTGALVHRLGIRLALAAGGVAVTVSGLLTALRPPVAAFIALQALLGYGWGVLESGLNVRLAALSQATARLNRLHAFFGVGALLGPPLAAWLLGFTRWTVVLLVIGLAAVPLTVAFLLVYPRTTLEPPVARYPRTTPGPPVARERERLLGAALRDRGVLLGCALLAGYVGVELSLGNWGFSYLVQQRGLGSALAGYSVSGYWLGLTLGRFLLGPVATRFGLTAVGLIAACQGGVLLAATLTWALPGTGAATVGYGLLGFFLGPIFPTTMAVAPALVPARLVATAIGVMNAGSVIGGSALPWLAGTLAQHVGFWTLLPYAAVLTGGQLLVCWRMTAHVRVAPAPST
jgi:fucose permease